MISFALFALIACVGISCIPIFLLGREVFARGREYFVPSEHTPPGVVRNSSIAYSLQIATFGQFFGWGAKGDFWPAMIFAAMFGAGLYLIHRLRLPMLAFMSQALERDRSVTVPGFIARQHGNDARVRLIAATLSVCALAGLIASAAVGAASLVKPILGGLNTTFPIACSLLVLMLLYTIPAGNSGAMRSAQVLLGILYFALIGSTLIVLYMLISSAGKMPPQGMFAVTVLATCCAIVLIYRKSRYIDTSRIGSPVSGEATDIELLGARLFRRFSWIVIVLIAVLAGTTLVIALIGLYAQGVTTVITENVSALRAETQTSISGLLTLVLLPIFYPIVDTTNWLRITALEIDPYSGRVGAGRNPETLTRVLAMYASVSALVWLLICMFGTIAVLATNTPRGADVLRSFIVRLASQQNDPADVASGLFLVSVIAMAVLTNSAMFSAVLATIRYDIIPTVWSSLAPERAQALARRRAVVAGSSLCVVMLIVLFVLNDNPALSFANSRFLHLQLACLCAQLAFGPLVLGPLISGNSAAISSAWAIAVISVGFAVGQGVIIVSLQSEHTAWLWSAIPACLGSGLSLYAVARFWTSKTTPRA